MKSAESRSTKNIKFDDAVRNKIFSTRISCFGEIFEKFGDINNDVTQVSSGPLDGDLRFFGAGGMYFTHISFIPDCIISTKEGKRLCFAIPVQCGGDFKYNGAVAGENTIFLSSGRNGAVSRSKEREVIGIYFDAEEFCTALGALRGEPFDLATLMDQPIELPPAVKRAIVNRVRAISDLCDRAPDEISGLQTSRLVAEQIKTMMLDIMLFVQPTETVAAPSSRDLARIVRSAEARFADGSTSRLSLADLCVAADCSSTTLHKAFSEYCGMSPIRYFKHRRLSVARNTLIQAKPSRSAVKRAAIDAGFTELGRFSVEYRELFGENPRATLANH